MTYIKSHASRVENMRALVAEFGKRDLLNSDIREMFGFSQTGVRSCTAELIDAHVIIISHRDKALVRGIGEPVFSITSNHTAISIFLGNLEAKRPKRDPRPRGYGEIATGDPARHVYGSLGESAMSVEQIAPVAPDPFALHSDFFKPSPDFCERRSEPRPEPVRLTGFAALDVRFERRVG